MKLGTLLLRNAEITLTQLEAALRTQVLYGGRLGTNLVELGFMDVDTLTLYLSESLGVPMATQEMFDTVAPAVIEAFGAERARRHEAFPLAGARPDVLPVAMVEPGSVADVARLSEELGVTVEPHVAPELRIYYYLEAHYGITRKARFVRMGTHEHRDDHDERRRMQPAGGIAAVPKVLLSPRPADAPAAPAVDAAGVPADAARAGTLQGSITYLEACAAIDRADHRDIIGDVLVAYADMRFGVAAIFLLRDSNALGWRLHHESPDHADHLIEELSLPLGGISALQTAHDSGRPYRGGPVSAGMPTERALWQALGVTSPPEELAVVPVLVRSRVVNLVYVHGLGAGPLDDKYLAELEKLAARAGAAYERLLMMAKSLPGVDQAADA